MQHHLQETQNQQDRLPQLITKLGGDPTDAKADLPKLMPPTTMMMKKALKDTFQLVTDDKTIIHCLRRWI